MRLFSLPDKTGINLILRSKGAGFSVLEVIIAIFILTVTSAILLNFLLSGDKLYGRNLLVVNAAQLAQNEAEALKAQSYSLETIEDNEFEEEIGNRMYVIKRTVLDSAVFDSLFSGYPIKVVEIHVMEGFDSEKSLTSFKMLQGYNLK